MPTSGIFSFFLSVAVFGAIIWVLSLLSRFVQAHERVAEALESMARKSKEGSGN